MFDIRGDVERAFLKINPVRMHASAAQRATDWKNVGHVSTSARSLAPSQLVGSSVAAVAADGELARRSVCPSEARRKQTRPTPPLPLPAPLVPAPALCTPNAVPGGGSSPVIECMQNSDVKRKNVLIPVRRRAPKEHGECLYSHSLSADPFVFLLWVTHEYLCAHR
ncbi:hypothetical protein EVAR_10782_1 [Eumeta japonica]|uniref:Uncharacterized protein n=1 Tax=Eumeta variegata TaxID=151549 RepID=A0A4C1W9J9_EUMVA|nr:hypothetical protein EVAR_10782_1 [Eumeta japonica]